MRSRGSSAVSMRTSLSTSFVRRGRLAPRSSATGPTSRAQNRNVGRGSLLANRYRVTLVV